MRCASFAVVMTYCLSVSAVSAAASDRVNWPVRTGPTMNGHIAAEDATGLPLMWNEAAGNGIAWKTPLEGAGHSAPIIGHGRVWLTAATVDGTEQFVYCINQADGEVVHHKRVFRNEMPEPLGNAINTYASPSCALEDDAVYVHFGTYGTARLDPKTAETVWERRDINCRHFRGPGSSPILWDNLLILTFDGINRQFLTALDNRTGETVWLTERTTDYGDLDKDGKPTLDGDLRKAYSTPGITVINGKAQVVSVGSKAAFAYDALTGKELWMVRHDDYNAAAPPSFFNEHAILNTGSRGANLLSVRLDETTRGDISMSHVVWNRDKGNSDLSAPVLIGDRIFSIANNGVLACVDATSGAEVWQDRLKGTFTSSPITDGRTVLFVSEEGDCTLIEAADKFAVVAANRLEGSFRASAGAADGHYFLRSFDSLYSIGVRSSSVK